MTRGEHYTGAPLPEIDHSSDMRMLFEVVEKKLGTAIARQAHNPDVRFFTFEHIEDTVVACVKLAQSYVDMSEGQQTDIIDLLVPVMIPDHNAPITEPLTDSPDAFFFARRFSPEGTAMLIVRPERMVRLNVPDDLPPFFGHIKDSAQRHNRAKSLALLIEDYDIVPSFMRRDIDPTESLL